MSGNKKIILILVVVAVAYFALLGFGLRSGRSDSDSAPDDEEGVANWMENSVPEWMKSFDKRMPKPRFQSPAFPLTLSEGDRKTVQIPRDDEHDYREAIFVHQGGPTVTLRYVPVNPDELVGAEGETALEFEVQAGAENRSRKSVIIGKSGGTLHLGSNGSGTARVGLAE